MIWDRLIDGFVAALTAALSALFALVPSVPSWVDGGPLNQIVGVVGGVGTWLPVSFAVQVAGAVVTAYLTAGFVGITRSLLSNFTGGGGAS